MIYCIAMQFLVNIFYFASRTLAEKRRPDSVPDVCLQLHILRSSVSCFDKPSEFVKAEFWFSHCKCHCPFSKYAVNNTHFHFPSQQLCIQLPYPGLCFIFLKSLLGSFKCCNLISVMRVKKQARNITEVCVAREKGPWYWQESWCNIKNK